MPGFPGVTPASLRLRLATLISEILERVFAILLLGGVPILSFLTARRSDLRLLPRPALYISAVASQWLLAALGVGVMTASSRSWRKVGFWPVPFRALLEWTALLVVVSVVALGLILILEQRRWWPDESELVYLLIPETAREKLYAVLMLAPTAAFCEEYLYRGYLLAQATEWLHSTGWGWAVSSVGFGLAHIYQGANGVLRASLLGALLAYPVVRLGSIYPSILAHLLIDAIALAWLGPAFLRRAQSS